MVPGKGVSCQLEGKQVIAGNKKLLREAGVVVEETVSAEADTWVSRGCTVIYTAINGELAGYLVFSDTVRKESQETTGQLKSLGTEPVLLTGDHESAAAAIAGQLGIQEVHAGCLPEEKLNWIANYQKKGEAVCMIGDGINDAPGTEKSRCGNCHGPEFPGYYSRNHRYFKSGSGSTGSQRRIGGGDYQFSTAAALEKEKLAKNSPQGIRSNKGPVPAGCLHVYYL